jgi:hypothetical protein
MKTRESSSGASGHPAPASNHLFAYTVQEYDGPDGKKARSWTRIGVAFPHKDGTGFNVELHSMPLDGRIVLFPPSDDARDDRNAAAPEPIPPPQNRSAAPRRR